MNDETKQLIEELAYLNSTKDSLTRVLSDDKRGIEIGYGERDIVYFDVSHKNIILDPAIKELSLQIEDISKAVKEAL